MLHYRDNLKLDEIGAKYNITRERVRQIICKGIRKLRRSERLQYLLDNDLVAYKKQVCNEREALKLEIEALQEQKKNLQKDVGLSLRVVETANKSLYDEYQDKRRARKHDPIEMLELSIRPYNCLRRAGIKTIAELEALSVDDLMRIRNMGRKSAREIIARLEEYSGYKIES